MFPRRCVKMYTPVPFVRMDSEIVKFVELEFMLFSNACLRYVCMHVCIHIHTYKYKNPLCHFLHSEVPFVSYQLSCREMLFGIFIASPIANYHFNNVLLECIMQSSGKAHIHEIWDLLCRGVCPLWCFTSSLVWEEVSALVRMEYWLCTAWIRGVPILPVHSNNFRWDRFPV